MSKEIFTAIFDCKTCDQTNEQTHTVSGLTYVECYVCHSKTNLATFEQADSPEPRLKTGSHTDHRHGKKKK